MNDNDATSTPSAWAPADSGPVPPVTSVGGLVSERPEVAVGAAFVGGLIAAMIVRRLGR